MGKTNQLLSGLLVLTYILIPSCTTPNERMVLTEGSFDVTGVNDRETVIDRWNISGPWSAEADTVLWTDFMVGNLTDSVRYVGLYAPKYNLLDFREVYDAERPEQFDSLRGKSLFLSRTLWSDRERNLYLHVSSALSCIHCLNGDTLQRLDIQGLNFYPIHLHRGNNNYAVRVVLTTDDASIEVALTDSGGVASQYVHGQSNNIVLPLVSPSSPRVILTNAHQNVFGQPVHLDFCDVRGKKVYAVDLQRDSMSYDVSGLESGHTYLCTMTLGGQTVRQPIVCGDYDSLYVQLSQQRHKLGGNHLRGKELDQVLYRYGFLLSHETRHRDWWWQFKVPLLAYQVEHTLAHLNSEHGQDSGEFNVQFVTYQSELDGGYQRYLLVTPNQVDRNQKYPLVVLVRPQVESHYRFFTSPQFTHQWALNIVQSLANQHQCIVMMPEARMYQTEDLIPMASAEMLLAIEDVKQHYPIDTERLYLHGICTGGYRALKMAALHPGLFAAVGVYAPTYHQQTQNSWENRHTLSALLPNLKGTPVLLFADPNDRHTPPERYVDLISDAQRYGVPLTCVQKRNTELLYNAVVAGREAFDFFDGKRRQDKTLSTNPLVYDYQPAVLDMYAEPFVYVYDHDNPSRRYRHIIEHIQQDYEEYMDSPLPLVPDNQVTWDMMSSKNIFLIGNEFCNPELQKLVDAARQEGDYPSGSLSIHRHPQYSNRLFLFWNLDSHTTRIMQYPWIDATDKEC